MSRKYVRSIFLLLWDRGPQLQHAGNHFERLGRRLRDTREHIWHRSPRLAFDAEKPMLGRRRQSMPRMCRRIGIVPGAEPNAMALPTARPAPTVGISRSVALDAVQDMA
jgi:hypothetical protein